MEINDCLERKIACRQMVFYQRPVHEYTEELAIDIRANITRMYMDISMRTYIHVCVTVCKYMLVLAFVCNYKYLNV